MALSRRVRIAIAGGVLAAVLAVGLTLATLLIAPLSQNAARDRFVATLAERFDAKVELQGLHLRVWPTLRADGYGLTIRHHGRTDVPPLISIAHFSAESGPLTFLRRHISRVQIEGLDIEIPPDHGDRPAGPSSSGEPDRTQDLARTLVVDNLYSMAARLVIIPSKPDKAPRVWDIHDLHMTSVSTGTAMPFEATLKNGVPPGEIVTRGSFGPWQPEHPGDTPLDGTFTFNDADLSVFDGISGMLKAHGEFGGQLDRIDVHGDTNTPEFRIVKTGGHPIPLHAAYHAIVDGTNGNTILEEIDASFFNTMIVARGRVVGNPNEHGRTVALDVSIERGRLEDLLRLAMDAPEAPMTGALRLKTSFVLPPGDIDVVQKLRLDGRFSLADMMFTSDTVQEKIDALSSRGRGRPDEKHPAMASKFGGRFSLLAGRLELPEVTFDVPGALVQLAGHYALERETVDFKGMLFLDAKVSETQSGIKRILLKIVDPLFRRDGGGSAIPIKVTGSRANPSFGMDRSRLFHHPRQP